MLNIDVVVLKKGFVLNHVLIMLQTSLSLSQEYGQKCQTVQNIHDLECLMITLKGLTTTRSTLIISPQLLKQCLNFVERVNMQPSTPHGLVACSPQMVERTMVVTS